MKPIHAWLGIGLFVAGLCIPAKAALEEQFTVAQLREDCRVLRAALEQLHAGLYLHTSREEMDKALDELSDSFNKPATRREFYLRAAPVVELAKCGHTYFDLPQRTLDALGNKREMFPLPLIFLGGRAHVDQTVGPIPLGAEIKSINRRPMTEILRQLMPYVRADGRNVTMKHRILDMEFSFHYLVNIGGSKMFEVDYLPHGRHEAQTVRLAGVNGETLREELTQRHTNTGRKKNYSFRELGDSTALLTVNSFDVGARRKGRQKYHDFLKKTFADLKAKPGIKNLIVDVRENEGGFEGRETRLFGFLAQKPFRDPELASTLTLEIPLENYMDRRELDRRTERFIEKDLAKDFKPNPAANNQLQLVDSPLRRPRGDAFKGRLWILTGGLTHSGGATLCSLAANNDNVTFVGEETGGNRFAYTAGNTILFRLPHTLCQLGVPIILYHNQTPAGNFPKDRGIIPDHSVTRTIADLRVSEDTVLRRTLELIQKEK